MSIPRTNQIPLNQPMYVNGQLHQAWIDFFQKVGGVADETGVYSLSGMSDAISTIQTNIASIQQSINTINQKISSIRNDIQSLQTQTEDIEQSIETLNTQYADLDSRVQALENA